VQPLGLAARVLDFSAIIYSARELRDGKLTRTDVELVANLTRIGRKWRAVADELVAHGRWVECQDPPLYVIHDYLSYQPSREQILAQREADRVRKAHGGQMRWTSNGAAG
jgi:hypothetical protein